MSREVVVNPGAFDGVPEDLMERAARHALATVDAPRAELSITLLDDVEIRRLNRTYLEKDRPTDVIAFSLGEGATVIGDVYIGYQQAARQAAELGIDLGEELVRLTVHGTLHVLGHDHPDGPERTDSAMFELQEALVEELLAEGGA